MPFKYNWYFNRLLAMSIPEVLHRFRQALRVLQERRFGLTKSAVYASGLVDAQVWTAFMGVNNSGILGNNKQREELASAIIKHFPQGFDATITTADALLRHHIELFSQSFDLGNSINWHADPKTGLQWPKQFWAAIDTRNTSSVGVKWVWELNRHHHIVTLAKAFFLTGDERFATEALAQIVSWIDQNPPLKGVNWTSSLELGIRLINWAWSLEFTKGSTALTEGVFDKICGSIFLQATYIERHLSAYSSGNNHRIGEAAGLAYIGLMFPGFVQADRWRKKGLQILTQDITALILPDGGPAEQAPHYLLFILDFYTLIFRSAEIKGNPIPFVVNQRLRAAACFIQKILDPSGNVPNIGDNDDACVVRLDDRKSVNNYRSILATIATWLNDPQLKAGGIEWDEKNEWLLGQEGKIAFDNLENLEQPSDTSIFKECGYVITGAESNQVVMDFGPLGFGSMAAHGHADSLSIWTSANGMECLVDSGTFAYQEAGAWRSYFRGTSAHNTIRIDGIDQSEMMGPFLWGRKAKSRLLQKELSSEYHLFVAEHDGYKKLDIIHRRSLIFLKPDVVAILDQVIGTGFHQIEQFWHFSPEYKISVEGKIGELTFGDVKQVFEVWSSPLDQFYVVSGQMDPMQGWISSCYGQKKPGPVLVHAGFCILPVKVFSILFPGSYSKSSIEHSKKKIQSILEGIKEP